MSQQVEHTPQCLDPLSMKPVCWVYGFHMKFRFIHKKAKEEGRWLTEEGRLFPIIADYIDDADYYCRTRVKQMTVSHRNGTEAIVLALVRIDRHTTEEERFQIVKEKVNAEQLEKLREVLGYKEGKKAKWYEIYDRGGRNDEDSSDDETVEDVLHSLRMDGRKYKDSRANNNPEGVEDTLGTKED